jgi:hypothetical protein
MTFSKKMATVLFVFVKIVEGHKEITWLQPKSEQYELGAGHGNLTRVGVHVAFEVLTAVTMKSTPVQSGRN